MYFSKVDICGINTAKLKTLSDEEKEILLKRASTGDENARKELIDGNLRLVLSIIQRFAGRGENMDDLFQVGCIGLIKAVDNFNTELGRSKKNLMAGEEKDLFNRIKENGIPILYFPNIHVEHVIPPQRTTRDYIVRMGQGVGMSERLRCQKIGKPALVRRHITELVKWGATCVLWIGYTVRLRPIVGNMLVLFRLNVTKGLCTRI